MAARRKDGRFKPGNEIGAATRFAVGNIPNQGGRFAVGDERIDKDGYTWVKVSDSKHGNLRATHSAKKCWRLKHHLIWEREHGEPVPVGFAVIFANRDKTDFSPGNIVAVPKGILSTMNALHLEYYDAESLALCIAIAQVRMSLRQKKRQMKEGAKR